MLSFNIKYYNLKAKACMRLGWLLDKAIDLLY